ncbi:MAG: hypothetical protein Kow0031_03190 [Anaerolineae bacterium]
MTNSIETLKTILPPEQVLTDPVQLLAYEMDAGLMDRAMPDGVVFPRSAADVVKLAQWAGRHNIPLVARAVGTGLAGGAVAHTGGVVVSFSQMNKVLEFDDLSRRAVAQPTVVNQKLGELVAAAGLYYPPDPASGRTSGIGGNIGTNAGGPHCFKYGVTTNYVTGLQVVLANGQQVQFGGKALDAPEYDFTGLLVGSEGTLGLITAATLRLVRQPPGVKTMMAVFNSVEQAGEAVSAIIARGLVPATMEMMDRQIMRIIEDYTHAGLPVESEAALILEVDGHPASLSPQIEEISALVRQHHATNVQVAHTEAERAAIWYARKSAAGALSRLAPAYYLVDGTVPRSLLAQALREINDICRQYEVHVGYVFHAGDGNLHPLILIPDPTDKTHIEHVHEAGRKIVQICVDKDGSITGEHGVGLEKRDYMPMMYSPAELGAMWDIKNLFDPAGLMNPGKVLPLDVAAPELPAPQPPADSPFAPASAAEAAAALRHWAELPAPPAVRIAGGGSKAGWLMTDAAALLSTANLSGIRAYARDDFYVTVGAGTRLADLQAELAADRMWAPLLSPWPEATVGGIVATSFNGPLRMRYGGLRDLTLTATVAMPDGRVIRAGRPVVKNVAGYDLPKLFVGSHGTLGLLTDITLKLAPLPRRRAGVIAPVDELGAGLAWGRELLRLCLVSSALLLLPGEAVPGVDAPYALLYSAEGMAEDVAEELAAVSALLREQGTSPELRDDLSGSGLWAAWLAATAAEESLLRVGIAPGELAALARQLAGDGSSLLADLPNGLLYLRPADVAAARRTAMQAGGYAVLLRAPAGRYAPAEVWSYAPQSQLLMRGLKAKWDPRGFLNTGLFAV